MAILVQTAAALNGAAAVVRRARRDAGAGLSGLRRVAGGALAVGRGQISPGASLPLARAVDGLRLAWSRSGAAARQLARSAGGSRLVPAMLIADAALALALTALWATAGTSFGSQAILSGRPSRAGLSRHPAAAATASLPTAPMPSRTPSPTPPPVQTATAIAVQFTEWDSWLPEQGGWNGSFACSGRVYAPAGTGHFIWPTDKRYLVGFDYNAWRHPGLDLGGEIGDPIVAADSGAVVYAGWNVYGFGNLVILDHGNGWHTLYAHLSEVHVDCGQAVSQGALLGLAGTTGNSRGPHLHFEMRREGANLNPWGYLPTP